MNILYIKTKTYFAEHTSYDVNYSTENESVLQLELDSNGKRLYIVTTEATAENFLSRQHAECEAVQVSFAEVEQEIKNSRAYHNVNEFVKNKIRERYSNEDEIKLVNLALADADNAEYLAYRAYVTECREMGNAQKAAMGMKE